MNDSEVVEPVCGMPIARGKAARCQVHEGRSYHYCITQCLEEFRANPAEYVESSAGHPSAPAQPAADVGIAMGTGTDVALENAGVTLLRGDLQGMVRARRLSAATMRNIRQNLLFAFVYNAAGVPVAAEALYPFFGILLNSIIVAAAMA